MDAPAALNIALAGRYSIERQVGQGGMARIYLARETRHDRQVALKVLSPELGAVLGVRRFLAEIQVTARLQHPNILPLFDSGEAEGLLFYVMPYVEGDSLRTMLDREKQLSVSQAVHIATNIALALDYAHREGVIHRDLKPENILLRDGEPLLADFGIALAVDNAGGDRITQSGISIGTPLYMSPEQALGDRVIDGRTDIYSLGAILYEMLTGEPPHSGRTAQAIVAKVITDRPRSIRLSRDTVPPDVENAVERALAKLPADRFQTARQFADALEAPGHETALLRPLQTSAALTRPRIWLTAAALLGSAFLVVRLGGDSLAARRKPAPSFVIDPPAPAGVPENIGAMAISRDGSTVAFVGLNDSTSQVYVRRLAEIDSRPLPGTTGAFELAFSPDGKWLAFVTWQGKLLKVPVDGSRAPSTITESAWAWAGVEWDSDSTVLISRTRIPPSGLVRLSVNGGRPQPLTRAAWQHGHPLVASDGKTLLFVEWGRGLTEDDFLAIGSLQSGEFTATSLPAIQPLGIINDRIVYLNTAGAIMAAAFDTRTRRIVGEPIRVVEDATVGITRQAALSRAGTLVYRRGRVTQTLVLADSVGASRELSPAAELVGRPAFSPDGSRIAVGMQSVRGETLIHDIWIFDVATRTFTRLTSIGNVLNPLWTPDGRYIVFATRLTQQAAIWRQRADGSQPAEKLLEPSDARSVVIAVSPDGRGVLYCHRGVFYLPFTGDRTPQPVWTDVPTPVCAGRFQVSPDGRWLAYVASDGDRPNVYIRPFRRAGGRVQISPEGGDSPTWSRDGTRLYYARTDSGLVSGTLHVAYLTHTSQGPRVTRRERVLRLSHESVYQETVFDVAPDSKHFIVMRQNNARVQLVVDIDWAAQFKKSPRGN